MFGITVRELFAFPFHRLRLETSIPAAYVLQRLQGVVVPRKWWRFSGSHPEFEGVVTGTTFKISRIINYRNSFLPIMAGEVHPRLQGGTRIDIEMRMAWLVALFMLLWAALPAAIVAAALLHVDLGLSKSGGPQHPSLQLFGAAAAMLLFGYMLCAIAFNIEAQRARTLLLKILDATLI